MHWPGGASPKLTVLDRFHCSNDTFVTAIDRLECMHLHLLRTFTSQNVLHTSSHGNNYMNRSKELIIVYNEWL